MKNDILAQKLEKISDAYTVFVEHVLLCCEHYADKNPNIAEQLLEFMNNKPDITSSEILEYQLKLAGLPYGDDDGKWYRWGQEITEEEAQRIVNKEYSE